jgi:pimeloyl-ACP methyl ester carboxylesterase
VEMLKYTTVTFLVGILAGYWWEKRKALQCLVEESEFVKRHSQLWTIRGKLLRVIHIENKESPLLMLFIHGLGGQATQWEDQLAYFKAYATVIAVDNIGHGKSMDYHDWSLYTTQAIVEDLLYLLNQFQHQHVILVGHSYGVQIISKLYPHVKDRIKGCILISPTTQVNRQHYERRRQLLSTPNWILDILRFIDRKGGIHSTSVNRVLYTHDVTLRKRQFTWNIQSRTCTLKRILYGIALPDIKDYQLITCPTLIFGALYDQVASPNDIYILKQWIPHAHTYMISYSGHNPMVERSDLVNRHMHQFIATFME